MARAAATMLREGASRGQVLDKLRSLSQTEWPTIMSFEAFVAQQLIWMQDRDLLAWVESYVTPEPLPLRRP
jgi:hypothetical protein